MKRKTWITLAATLTLSIEVLCGCKESQTDSIHSKIHIAAILPLTGSAAELAVQHRRGLEVGVDHVNQMGGVNGKLIQLIVEDDQNDPKMTVAAMEKLVTRDKVTAVFTVMSGPSMAIAPIADREQLVLFANCGHSEVTALHKHVFRNFPSSNLEVRRMADFCSKNLKLKSLWMLYIDDAYGQGAVDLAVKEFPLHGVRILGKDGYGKSGVDLRPALVRVATASPDAVYVYGYGKATADVVNQLREVGYKGKLLGSYNFSQPPVTTIAKTSIEGAYYTVPIFNYEASKDGTLFLQQYRAQFRAEPLWNAVIEYDAVMILARALGISQQNTLSLPEALRRVGRYTGVAGDYEYDATTKDWLTPMSISHVVDGKVEYEK